jgi:hypothetical protein
MISVSMMFLSCMGRAAVTFHTERPGSVVTVAEARKLSREKTVYKCTVAVLSESGGARKKPSTKTTWHTAVGEDQDAAQDALDAGKSVYKCVGQAWDADRKKLVNAD